MFYLDTHVHKRRRLSAEPKEIEDRLESLIMRVGDKVISFNNFLIK